MNTWSPISESRLWDHVIRGEQKMDVDQTRLWELIRIDFKKWQLHPWGDLGGGFWVVGLLGSQVLWYNDIEEGFNWSHFKSYGTIDGHFCDQSELHDALLHLQYILRGYGGLPKFRPPQPSKYGDG